MERVFLSRLARPAHLSHPHTTPLKLTSIPPSHNTPYLSHSSTTLPHPSHHTLPLSPTHHTPSHTPPPLSPHTLPLPQHTLPLTTFLYPSHTPPPLPPHSFTPPTPLPPHSSTPPTIHLHHSHHTPPPLPPYTSTHQALNNASSLTPQHWQSYL